MYIRQCIENSIKRLGTTPDLYYQHRVDPKVQVTLTRCSQLLWPIDNLCRSLEETYGTLEELRKEGKFKYIGISEPSAETLRKAAKV